MKSMRETSFVCLVCLLAVLVIAAFVLLYRRLRLPAGYTCHGTDRDGLDVFGVYSDYVYRCRSLSLAQCQRRETQQGNYVVKFSRGKHCDDSKCEENCGCLYNGKTYSHGESFKIGCQYCKCTLTGSVECSCAEIYRRKEVRDMTQEEMEKYQDAVKQLSKTEHPSAWFRFAQMFADYKPQAVGNPGSLPWHRYFLRMVERELQTIDCSITIPYYDWTLNAGDQQRSRIWAANKFGGNGEGVTGCVTHHPFKEYYPPYWAPCLRRQFNPSIMLPDVIDVQYALNEDSYEKFRLSMELYMNIFKLWVGGHMASDFAPYDPLYLSVAAFVDRIWWDWEQKQEERFLAYPQELRFVPMSPFRTTPDDVMDSKKQMCVTYFPMTEGAVCNITEPTYGFSTAGYDRHGFDREGYDVDGYDVHGVDRNGKLDERGLFNTNGYDRLGYMRSGFDSSGFDRFGFSTNNYNIDGYDPAGYDRSGYDRHGFNRNGVTASGFHRNGSSETNAISESYDRYGYNRYGRDRYGFDRQGYDVYGFDSTGYDRNRCNRYYLGPMLVIIKRWAEVELNNIDDKTMRIITRICPAVTPLPEWRYTVNWLQRGDQVPLIEGILGRAQQRAHSLETTTRADNVIVGPDRSLCFVTYYYAECPFGKFPVSCREDLCADRKCPEYPDAVCRVNRCGECSYEWYHGHTGNIVQCEGCIDRDGMERGEGHSWPVSVCETCSCQEGRVSCTETRCIPPDCGHPSLIPGQCCPSCDSCLYEDQLRMTGDRFTPASDACDVCDCRDGTVRCQHVPCAPVQTCQTLVTLEGECCPSCIDCGLHGNGTVWKETPCQRCKCLSGAVECERIRCIPPDCSHPVTPPGECCPACDGCLADGRTFYNGETYFPDDCNMCTCRDGNFRCDPTPCPEARCRNPITPPGQCCPVCDNAIFRNKINSSDFDSWDQRIQVQKVIPHFKCTLFILGGSVQCYQKGCDECSHPADNDQCCPVCRDCLYEGRFVVDGEHFLSVVDPCQVCVCQRGSVRCVRQSCPRPECDNPVRQQGRCCPTCPVCEYRGSVYSDVETFRHPVDSCQICTCEAGRVRCESEPCRDQCSHPVPGLCCPRCDQCQFEGRVYDNNAGFKPDICQTCSCNNGNVRCEAQECVPLTCLQHETRPGQCCPTCIGCVYNGETYSEGSEWMSPDNPCSRCTCSSGLVVCTEVQCYTPCDSPVIVPGQCCMVCPMCQYSGVEYQEGQTFSPSADPCDTCTCVNAELKCEHNTCSGTELCPPGQLVAPPPGTCCPSCSTSHMKDCTRNNVDEILRPRPNDPCFYCRCLSSLDWVCGTSECPKLSCPPTVQRSFPGQCCLECPACYDDVTRQYYHNGDVWQREGDCQRCSCSAGQVRCTARACPILLCGIDEHLVTVPGQCCPECRVTRLQDAECQYEGFMRKTGEEWHVDECTSCRCVGGSVRCTSDECITPQCGPDDSPSLLPGTCCPVCLPKPGTCIVYGDPHYQTFDGTTVHFQGTCKYVMATDCKTQNFIVEVHHDARGVPGVSWAQNFTVVTAGIKIDLLQQHVVLVNDVAVTLPYTLEQQVSIERSGNSILLNTAVGVKLLWNGESYAELTVPGNYKRKMCGLCGNFNGFPHDDLRTKAGQITNSPALFGNSWKTTDQSRAVCADATDADPCVEAGYQVRRTATTKCEVIMGASFSRCHRVNPVETYFSSCVYDLCACTDESRCLCDILQTYVKECAKAGVRLEWRTPELCAMECDTASGFVFDECGPVCPRTCRNWQTQLGQLSDNCYKPCVAGCQCSADKVIHNGQCISPHDCPKLDDRGQ